MGSLVLDLAIGVGIFIAAGAVVNKVRPGTVPFPGTPDLSGGQQGATIGVGPVTGTPGATNASYPSPGSRQGNQVFMACGSKPQCGSLTNIGGTFGFGGDAPYQQNGYIDPVTGQFVHSELSFTVYRCLNIVTGADDGYYYLAPNC